MEIRITKGRSRKRTDLIDQSIIRIGSAPENDIALSSKSIEPFHLQILLNSGEGQKNYLVNLTGQPVAVTLSQEAFWLSPFATSEIHSGDEIDLEEYNLSLNLPVRDHLLLSSRFFEAALDFPANFLHPDTILEGILTIRNLGEAKGCKFKVEAEGIPEDCFGIDPVPLLYPGATEKVPFRLYHHGVSPAAGYLSFRITLTAPECYPDQKVIQQYVIYVTPSYKQRFTVREETNAELVIATEPEALPVKQWKTITFENTSESALASPPLSPIDPPTEKDKAAPISELPPQFEPPVEALVKYDHELDLPSVEAEAVFEPVTGEPPEEDITEIAAPQAESEPVQPSDQPPPPARNKPPVKVIGDQFKEFWDEQD
jgi:hypothetical protein